MSREVTATAPAKVNLSLGVGPVRDDGYHPLATVYQAVGVYDDVTVRAADRTTLSITGEGVDVSDVPADETNLALRAALLLAARHGIGDGVQMSIRKRIPVAGGLAGGSTDAAAALVACDALWGTRTPREEMASIAAGVGSDVPFCLVGGTAVGSGRGEAVTPAMTRGGYWWVLAVADDGLSTPAVYREFDKMHARVPTPDPEVPGRLMAALRAGDVEKLGRSLSNDLQRAAFRLRPELEALVGRGLEATAHGALVSGSGPTCLFLAENEAHAAQVRDRLAGSVPRLLCAPAPVPGAHVIR
jgi:4-diphosphocytidyl-2-C-methyl-D-erythritol kinase